MSSKITVYLFKSQQDNVPEQRNEQNQPNSCLVDLAGDTPINSSSTTPVILPEESSIKVQPSPNRALKPQARFRRSKSLRFLCIGLVAVVICFILRRIFWPSIPSSISSNTIEMPSYDFKPMDYDIPKIPEIPSLNTSKGQEYCSTFACKKLRDSILDAMDSTVDPCSDFYQYACGGWIRQHSEFSSNNFQALWVKNLLVLKDILENTDTKSTAENKAQTYYKSCLDKQELESLGATPMLDLLQKIGGWNISGHFDIEKWDFQHTLQLLSSLPTVNKLFSWAVGVDMKNNSRNIIKLDQAILGLRVKDNFFDIYEMIQYLRYMKKVGILLGGQEDSTEMQMRKVILLEFRLSRIMIPDKDEANLQLLYNKMTIGELTELAPAIDWLQYFNFAFKDVNRVILPSDEIIVTAPGFFSEMSELLEEYLSTAENRTILANYLGWSLVQGLVTRLPKSFQLSKSIVDAEMFKVDEDEGIEAWLSCITQTDETMGFALGAMFVRKVFREDSKPKVEQMINEIREAFLQNLPSLHWLDDDTKTLIKEKIDAISVMIGYPDFIMDQSKLDQYYRELVISPSDHFGNTIRSRQFLVLKNLEKLDEKDSQIDWQLTPPTVNAYYTPIKNHIVVPAGILQDPFYDPENQNPKFWTFGRFGFLIGHELMHSIDNEGRLFDKLGNLHEWMKDAAIKKFEKQAQCFVDQYSAYEEDGVYLDGNQTLPDNLADNGGLRTAFKAYENWVNNHGKEPSFPSVSLNHKQLFFVSFAQMWCASMDKGEMKKALRKWTHSPHKYRVLGTLSNSEDFAREFNCRPNSMDTKKCKLW